MPRLVYARVLGFALLAVPALLQAGPVQAAGGLVQPASPRRYGLPVTVSVVLLLGVLSLHARLVASARSSTRTPSCHGTSVADESTGGGGSPCVTMN